MIRLKNILAENMLRFGPKNLSEYDRRNLKRLTEAVDTKVTALADYPAAYKHFAALINQGTTTPSTYIGTDNIWIAQQNSQDSDFMYLNIFAIKNISFGGFQFPVPLNLQSNTTLSITKRKTHQQPNQGIWATDTTTAYVVVPEQNDFVDVVKNSSAATEISNQYDTFISSGGTAVDIASFIQKNPSKFNFATTKGQVNFATVTAALKNSLAKEVAKTIAA
jgi:hypothetical protein